MNFFIIVRLIINLKISFNYLIISRISFILNLLRLLINVNFKPIFCFNKCILPRNLYLEPKKFVKFFSCKKINYNLEKNSKFAHQNLT